MADNTSDARDAGDGAAPLECATDCDPCPNGSHCFKSGSFNKPIIPACLRLCNSTDECEPGETCLIPGCGPSPQANAYCVSATLPAQCGTYETGHCDYFGYAECRDTNTLVTGVSKIGVFSGLKLVRCPAGCNGFPVDGGGYPANCN